VSSAIAARVRAVPAAAVRAVPAWAWLAGIVAVSAGVRYAFARRLPAPWIMVDELIYSELAKSFAETGGFLLRGVAAGGGYGLVYPALISPAWLLFDAVPDAYAAAKVINSVVISLAAVPAYALARRLVAEPLALLAAALSVALPSLLYAGTLMTENAFYPIFLAAALALVRALERPTAVRTLVFLALAGLAFLTRAQAVVLVPALATAPLALVVVRGGVRPTLAAYRTLYGVLAGGVALVLLAQLVRGRSLESLLGAYSSTAESGYDLGAVAKWLVYHLAELDLYLGVLPFAAFLLLLALARRLARDEQAFVVAAASISFWLLLVVAAFASEHTFPPRIEERNAFYLAPFFLIALLALVERGLPRPRPVAAVAAVTAALLPAILPYESLIGVQARSDTFALLTLWSVNVEGVPLGAMGLFVAGCGLLLGALFLLVPARYALVLPGVVLAYFAVSLQPIEASAHGIREASVGALFQGITAPRPDWIDAAVGSKADVAVVWSGRTDAFTVWENEFFNRSVGPVYHLSGPVPSGLAQEQLRIDPDDGLLRDPRGRAVTAPYALVDDSVRLVGREVARDEPKGLAVLAVDGPLRTTTYVGGVYEDSWSTRAVTYKRFRCAGGSLTVTLGSDPKLFSRPQKVIAISRSRVVGRASVPPGGTRAFTVPLRRGAGGNCVVRFLLGNTAVPADVQPGSDDFRALGVRFLAFDYTE
jgi:hypothetical protein